MLLLSSRIPFIFNDAWCMMIPLISSLQINSIFNQFSFLNLALRSFSYDGACYPFHKPHY